MFVGLGAVILLLLFYFTWKLFFSSQIRIPLSPESRPFTGHIHAFAGITPTTKYKYYEAIIRLTNPAFVKGPIGHIKFWFTSIVTLSSVKTAELLLKSNTNIEKSDQYKDLKRWLMDSVLMLPGDAWRIRRKKLTPAFHFAVLEDFEIIMKEHANMLVDVIKKDPSRPIVKHILDIALHTIIETSFGEDFKSLDDSKPLFDAMEKVSDPIFGTDFSILSSYSSWYYYNISSDGRREAAALKELSVLIMKIVNGRKRELALGETRLHNGRRSFLDHMVHLQAEEGELTDEQIVGESNAIMLAGHGTTTATVSWTLYYLCKHPQVQERLYREIAEHLAGRPFRDLEVGSLAYLNMVVKESLRIQPPITSISRRLNESMTIDGWVLPSGTQVEMFIWWIHRDPEFWPEPEKFDPERFSVENSRGRNPYAFVPFSAGPRNCIGQRFASLESRLLVASVIHNFRVSTDQELGRELRREFMDVSAFPGPDFRIKCQPRSN